jgi:hypothetical protein
MRVELVDSTKLLVREAYTSNRFVQLTCYFEVGLFGSLHPIKIRVCDLLQESSIFAGECRDNDCDKRRPSTRAWL